MTIRVGINGFGRIGRQVYRAIREHYPDRIDVVAVNDVGNRKIMTHLLKYDTNYGRFPGEVRATAEGFVAGGDDVEILAERDPARLPWKQLGVEVVVESTGFFREASKARAHLEAGAKKVIITAPATEPDVTLALGVNEDAYDPDKHHVISNASCTTNCLAPVAKVLNDAVGIERGIMTTIHAYTADQNLQDGPHKDLRRARAAAANLVPTSTGAAKAVGLVLPELDGKLNGIAVRAPVITGSVIDLVCEVSGPTSKEAINEAFAGKADSGALEGILRYSEDALVSTDIVGSSYSSVFDAPLTMVIDEKLVKVVAWYDNEWGYSNRVVELAQRVLAGAPVA